MTNQKKPIIGILTKFLTIQEGIFEGLERLYVNRDYINGVVKAGGVPLLLPMINNSDAICHQVEIVDAILIPGGHDLHPRYYGEEPSSQLESVCLERDVYEMAIVKHAFSLNKPIFGICRGMQLINVAFGGSLYQDIIQSFPENSLKHAQEKKDEVSHAVAVSKDSKLFEILEKSTFLTNSFHHQAVKKLAPGFRINARAEDGIIEGIEMEGSSFILGVQWHPELMLEKHIDMQKLFSAFVCATIQQERQYNG